MKITLDSTILVRAFDNTGGSARRLLFTILDRDHVLVFSNEILSETSRVLRYPRMKTRHGMSESRIYEYVLFLQSVATMVRPDPMLIVPIGNLHNGRRFFHASCIDVPTIDPYSGIHRYRTDEATTFLNPPATPGFRDITPVRSATRRER